MRLTAAKSVGWNPLRIIEILSKFQWNLHLKEIKLIWLLLQNATQLNMKFYYFQTLKNFVKVAELR